jgi:hypothetical protein
MTLSDQSALLHCLTIVDKAIDLVQYSDRRADDMHAQLTTAVQGMTSNGTTTDYLRERLKFDRNAVIDEVIAQAEHLGAVDGNLCISVKELSRLKS